MGIKRSGFLALGFCLVGASAQAHSWGAWYVAERPTFLSRELISVDIYRWYLENQNRNSSPMDTSKSDNKKEWMAYFGDVLSEEDARLAANAVYDADSRSLIDTKTGKFDNDKLSFLKRLSKPRRKSFLAYLLFMRRLEPVREEITKPKYRWKKDEWYKGDAKKDLAPFMKEARQRVMGSKADTFMQLRWAYQAIRMANYSGEYEEVISLYKKYVARTGAKGLVRYWSLGWRARAFDKLGQKENSLRDYLNIFDQSPTQMEMARLSIKRIASPEDLLAYSKKKPGSYRSSTALVVLGLWDRRDYSPDSLKPLASQASDQIRTEALLVRSALALEHDIAFEAEAGFVGPIEKEWPTHEKLIKICKKTSELDRTRRPALWLAIAGYLSLLDQDLNSAKPFLEKATKLVGDDPVLEGQIHFLTTLMKFQEQSGKFDRKLQARMAKDLRWAESLSNPNDKKVIRSIWTLAGQKFLYVGDLARAALSFAAAGHREKVLPMSARYVLDAIASDDDLEVAEHLLRRPGTQPVDRLLKEKAGLWPSDILMVRGLRALREENYKEASNLFGRLENGKRKYQTRMVPSRDKAIAAEPHTLEPVVFSYSKFNHEIGEKGNATLGNEMDFARHMWWLKSSAERSCKEDRKDCDKILLQLGNSLFSLQVSENFPTLRRPRLRQLGYSWYEGPVWGGYYRGGPPYSELDGKYPLNHPALWKKYEYRYKMFKEEADNWKRASRYYQMVLDRKKDPESTAKAHILMAISRNMYLSKMTVGFLDTQFYESLAKGYSETTFYKEFAKTCPLIESFK